MPALSSIPTRKPAVRIAAIIDTADEITHLGRIRFEDASDIVLLYNILGTYIRMNDLDEADTEEEGGDQ